MVQYTILLPRYHNDGREVAPELFLDTYEELMGQFGGVSIDTVEVAGYWVHEGRRYEDLSQRVTVVGDDTAENDAFMRQWKETLKQRFEQIEIWITAQRIEVI